MADVVRTCANCGNTQTVGDFCEKCGTRMPAAVAPPTATPPTATPPAATAPVAAAVGAATAYTAAHASTPPPTTPPPYGAQPQYSPQPQYGAPQYGAQAPSGAPQYGYAPDRGGWGKLFDFSFQGFVTEGTLKTLYLINLALIGLYVLFNIIYVAMAGNRFTVISFFISLFVAIFWFFLSRIIFELMATAMRIRDGGSK